VYVHAQEGALSSSDRQRTSVRRYSPTLSLLRTYPGAPTSPIYVTSSPRQGPYLSGTTVGADGRVLVSSGFVFGNGNPASFYQWLQPSDGSWQPTQLTFAHTLYEGAAVDRAGHLYLSDAVNDSLVKLSPRNLTTIYAQLGGTGTGNGNFSGPVGVAVDDDCSVYVSDAGNSRVQKLSYATGCG
jgi:hypothetical protein